MPDESPEVQAQIDRLFEGVFQTLEANEKKLTYAFLIDNVPGYEDLPAKLFDLGAFGPMR